MDNVANNVIVTSTSDSEKNQKGDAGEKSSGDDKSKSNIKP